MLSRDGTVGGLGARGSAPASSGAGDLCGTADGIIRRRGGTVTRAPKQQRPRMIKSHKSQAGSWCFQHHCV